MKKEAYSGRIQNSDLEKRRQKCSETNRNDENLPESDAAESNNSLVLSGFSTPNRNTTPIQNIGKTNSFQNSNVKSNDMSKREHLETALLHLALANESKLAIEVKLRLIELAS